MNQRAIGYRVVYTENCRVRTLCNVFVSVSYTHLDVYKRQALKEDLNLVG